MITDTGMIIRVATTEIPTLSRATSGVKLMRSNGASVVDFTVTEHEEPEEFEEAEGADEAKTSEPSGEEKSEGDVNAEE